MCFNDVEAHPKQVCSRCWLTQTFTRKSDESTGRKNFVVSFIVSFVGGRKGACTDIHVVVCKSTGSENLCRELCRKLCRRSKRRLKSPLRIARDALSLLSACFPYGAGHSSDLVTHPFSRSFPPHPSLSISTASFTPAEEDSFQTGADKFAGQVIPTGVRRRHRLVHRNHRRADAQRDRRHLASMGPRP